MWSRFPSNVPRLGTSNIRCSQTPSCPSRYIACFCLFWLLPGKQCIFFPFLLLCIYTYIFFFLVNSRAYIGIRLGKSLVLCFSFLSASLELYCLAWHLFCTSFQIDVARLKRLHSRFSLFRRWCTSIGVVERPNDVRLERAVTNNC